MICSHDQMAPHHKAGGISVGSPIEKRDHALQSVRILLCEFKFQRYGIAFVLLDQLRGRLSRTSRSKQTQNQRNKHQTAKLSFHPSLLERKQRVPNEDRAFLWHDYCGRASSKN